MNVPFGVIHELSIVKKVLLESWTNVPYKAGDELEMRVKFGV